MTAKHFKSAPWLLLFGRAALFFGIQCLFALGYLLAGSQTPWNNSAAWWTLSVFIANLICLAMMVRQFCAEGKSYWSIFTILRENIKTDLLSMLGVLIITLPISMLPNILLAIGLYGDPQIGLTMLVRPLPFWAVIASLILFPLTQGLVEIPTYFSFAMPRLEVQGQPRWLALALPVLMLGLQHIAVPFLFDLRYIAWRGLMFLPFALLVGLVMRWRPRLLPYMAIMHILLDFSFAIMLLPAAY
jgi:hypothetical protein